VLSVAGLSMGAGISAFGVTVVAGDVAAAFGDVTADDGPLGQIGCRSPPSGSPWR
jgi:hypothetical protein